MRIYKCKNRASHSQMTAVVVATAADTAHIVSCNPTTERREVFIFTAPAVCVRASVCLSPGCLFLVFS